MKNNRIGLLSGLIFMSVPVASHAIIQLPQTVYADLRSGDIIMRKGGGPLSYQLMNESGENFSHCGMVVFHGERWSVIQSMANQPGFADGVQLIPITDFVKYTTDSTLFICRTIIDTSKNDELVTRAFYYLGQHIPFDHRFDLRDEEKFYCSELLLHIFLDVFGHYVFEIRPQHKTYIPLFATFFDASKFLPVFQFKPIEK